MAGIQHADIDHTGLTGVGSPTHTHAGADITSGTVAEARIHADLARDSEVTSAVGAHTGDTSDAHDASAVSFDPTGLSNTAATELQTAMEDFDAAIDAAGGGSGATASESDLGADVGVPTAGTYVDVFSTTPASGTYCIWANILWTTNVSNTDAAYGRLLKGAATVLNTSEDDVLNNAGQYHTLPLLAGNVAFDGSTTLKVQLTGARSGTMTAKREMSANGGSNKGSKLVLLKIA